VPAGVYRCRARELGSALGTLSTGPRNAITDVPGVAVGHCTVWWGGPELPGGQGAARTGVTAHLPHQGDLFRERVRAGVFVLNGIGEVIGSTAIREWGLIETPIVLTNSQGIGIAYDATARWLMARDETIGLDDTVMPVVGECDDGFLNDVRGMHVLPEHVHAALDAAALGPVAEGAVGAGTGMVCHDFKGGIGTSSRLASVCDHTYTVGVLALTNFGVRDQLLVDGVPVGREITDLMPVAHREGSCIVVLATDAPLSSRQCTRVAKRCALGLGRSGSYASDGSGEIMVAFSTAGRVPRTTTGLVGHERVGDDVAAELFVAAVDATAEAVLNSMCAATDVAGRAGNVVYALPLDRLTDIMTAHGRPASMPAGLPG
jgi:D-aminopeptidase